MKIAALGTLVLLFAAAAPAAEKPPKCHDDPFEGYCVALQVNGQRTIRLTKRTKKQLEARDSISVGGCRVRYEVRTPIRGDLDLRVDWIPEAVAYFGPGPGALVHVHPLDGQSLDTRPEISSAPSVRAGGQAVMTQADVIEGNRLPPGRYVLTARVSGSIRSWDCHAFFMQVAQ